MMKFIKKDAIRFTDIETGSTEEELLENITAMNILLLDNSIIKYYIAFTSGVSQVSKETFDYVADYVELNNIYLHASNELTLKTFIKKKGGKHEKESLVLTDSKDEKDTVKLLEDLYSVTINVSEGRIRYFFVFNKQYPVRKASYRSLVNYLESR